MTKIKNAAVTGDRKRVGLFIRLPEDLAADFPSLEPEDDSPTHVTFLYVGEVPANREEEFLAICGEVFASLEAPVKAWLHQLDHFVHPDNDRRVAHMSVGFNRQMALYRDRLIDHLKEAGFDLADSFPLVYRPHVTLGYMPDAHDHQTHVDGYKLFGPQGSWEFDSVEVWGLPKLVSIPLGVAPPPVANLLVHRVAQRHLKKAAQVGTDTAAIYAISPEMMDALIQKFGTEKIAEMRLEFDSEGMSALDKEVRKFGVFHTGGDGSFEVKIEMEPNEWDLPKEFGYTKPYGTKEFVAYKKSADRVAQKYLERDAK